MATGLSFALIEFSNISSILPRFSLYLVYAASILTIALWLSHPFSVQQTRAEIEDSKAVALMLVLLAMISSTFAYLFILNLFGRLYEAILFISLISVSAFQSQPQTRDKKGKPAGPARSAVTGTSTATLSLIGFAMLFTSQISPLYVIPIILLSSFLSTRNMIRMDRLERAARRSLMPVFAISLSEITFIAYPLFAGYGIALFFAVGIIFAVLGILLSMLSRVSFVSRLNDILLLAIVLLTIPTLLYTSYTFLLLTLAIVQVALILMGNSFFDGQFRIVVKSLRFGKRSFPAVPILGVSVIGLSNFFGLFPSIFSFGSISWLSGNLPALLGFLIALLILSGLSRTGNGSSSAVLYTLSIFLFFWGLYTIFSIRYGGFWDTGPVISIFIALPIAAIVLYEPTFRAARGYSTKIPVSLSISHQLGSTQYLRGRYDVNLEKNKKRNKDLLGAGGFAYVFKGRDVMEGKDVVVKVPRVYDEESKGDRERKELLQDAIRQLTSESKVLSSLNYPGIVGFIDFFRENNDYYLVEEYADGKNLSRFLGDSLRPGQKWGEDEVFDFAVRLLLSLNYMHMHEVFHRDLNPGNVVLSEKTPKIIDFGTSKTLLGRMSKSFFSHSQRVGVPCYHPPELDLDQKIPASSSYDTYSVGALMCSMVTGKFLDDEEMRKKYGLPFVNARYLVDEVEGKVSQKMFDIIKKTVSYNADERYQSAFEILSDLFGFKGDFVVTDIGNTYSLTPESKFNVVLNPSARPPETPGKPPENGDLILKDSAGSDPVAGALSYSESHGKYVISSYRRRTVYRKKIGTLLEKALVFALEPGYTYSFDADFKSGIFEYYRRL